MEHSSLFETITHFSLNITNIQIMGHHNFSHKKPCIPITIQIVHSQWKFKYFSNKSFYFLFSIFHRRCAVFISLNQVSSNRDISVSMKYRNSISVFVCVHVTSQIVPLSQVILNGLTWDGRMAYLMLSVIICNHMKFRIADDSSDVTTTTHLNATPQHQKHTQAKTYENRRVMAFFVCV